jgi:SAM-dependent methyltransferase
MKEWIKHQLRTVGLYDTAHELWNLRRNLRVSCWNAGYRLAGAGDGLPIPPARLIFLVTISREISWYLHSGRMCYNSLCYALQRNGFQPDSLQAILDFGCGRVLRHWKPSKGTRLYGTDYNPQLITWCQRKLGRLAEFQTNNLAPPLNYEDEKFDLIYVISVFTHLSEDLQYAWMDELARVLKPGGVLLLTLHGQSRLLELEPEERQKFNAGQLVVKSLSLPGSNLFGAYHPVQYVRDHLAKGFEMLDFIPEGARDADQDIYLLRKPAGKA